MSRVSRESFRNADGADLPLLPHLLKRRQQPLSDVGVLARVHAMDMVDIDIVRAKPFKALLNALTNFRSRVGVIHRGESFLRRNNQTLPRRLRYRRPDNMLGAVPFSGVKKIDPQVYRLAHQGDGFLLAFFLSYPNPAPT